MLTVYFYFLNVLIYQIEKNTMNFFMNIGIESKLIDNNETDLRPGINKLKWQMKLLEKAKNTQGRNIMKDVEVEEWMWKYRKPKESM